MSPFIVKRIHKECVFILDNELLTKEDLLKKENWKENIRFSSIEDIKYFFDEFINEDKSLRFACNGDVVEYHCNKCIYCPLHMLEGKRVRRRLRKLLRIIGRRSMDAVME